MEDSAMGILSAILLTGFIVFANWTRNYIEQDRKAKESRIKILESQVAELQRRYNDELVELVKENKILTEANTSLMERLERIFDRIERKLDG
jgi:diketogulonate reductase-like aldo/keto reductase